VLATRALFVPIRAERVDSLLGSNLAPVSFVECSLPDLIYISRISLSSPYASTLSC